METLPDPHQKSIHVHVLFTVTYLSSHVFTRLAHAPHVSLALGSAFLEGERPRREET